jgi:hypothetical protein
LSEGERGVVGRHAVTRSKTTNLNYDLQNLC